jgi:hypothetical protein
MSEIQIWAMLFAGVFVGSLTMDWLFARWTRSVVNGQRTTATVLSGAYYGISMVVIATFIGNAGLIAASVGGHMLGTWLAVKPAAAVNVQEEQALQRQAA